MTVQDILQSVGLDSQVAAMVAALMPVVAAVVMTNAGFVAVRVAMEWFGVIGGDEDEASWRETLYEEIAESQGERAAYEYALEEESKKTGRKPRQELSKGARIRRRALRNLQ